MKATNFHPTFGNFKFTPPHILFIVICLSMFNHITNGQAAHFYPEKNGNLPNHFAQSAIIQYVNSSNSNNPPDGMMMVGTSYDYLTNQSFIRVIVVNKVGDLVWSKTYGDFDNFPTYLDRGFGVVRDPNDNTYVICGYERGSNPDADNLALLHIDDQGNTINYDIFTYSTLITSSGTESLYGFDIEVVPNSNPTAFVVVGMESDIPLNDVGGNFNSTSSNCDKRYFAMQFDYSSGTATSIWTNLADNSATSALYDVNTYNAITDVSIDPNNSSRLLICGNGIQFDPTAVAPTPGWQQDLIYGSIDLVTNIGSFDLIDGSGTPGQFSFLGNYASELKGYKVLRDVNGDFYCLGNNNLAHGFTITWVDPTNPNSSITKTVSNWTSSGGNITAFNFFDDPNDADLMYITGCLDQFSSSNKYYTFITKFRKSTFDLETSYVSIQDYDLPGSGTNNSLTPTYWNFPFNSGFPTNDGQAPLYYAPQHSLMMNTSSPSVAITGGGRGTLVNLGNEFHAALAFADYALPSLMLFPCSPIGEDYSIMENNVGSQGVLLSQYLGAPNFLTTYSPLEITSDADVACDGWKPASLDDTEDLVSTKLYPTITDNFINIETNMSKIPMKYSIHSADGKILQHGEIHTNKSTINIDKLNQGIYFIMLNEKNGNKESFKVIKN